MSTLAHPLHQFPRPRSVQPFSHASPSRRQRRRLIALVQATNTTTNAAGSWAPTPVVVVCQSQSQQPVTANPLAKRLPPSHKPAGRALITTTTITTTQTAELSTTSTSTHNANDTMVASLSRVVYSSVSPTVRIASQRTSSSAARGSSPFSSIIPSVVVLAVTVGTAAIAAIRARLRAVRECRQCHGYGVQRCKLCQGRGTIEWEGKMAHREPCPMCLGKRMNACTCCGGSPLMARHLFAHKHRTGKDIVTLTLLGGGGGSSTARREGGVGGRLSGLLLRARRGVNGVDHEERVEQSERLKEEIMMD